MGLFHTQKSHSCHAIPIGPTFDCMHQYLKISSLLYQRCLELELFFFQQVYLRRKIGQLLIMLLRTGLCIRQRTLLILGFLVHIPIRCGQRDLLFFQQADLRREICNLFIVLLRTGLCAQQHTLMMMLGYFIIPELGRTLPSLLPIGGSLPTGKRPPHRITLSPAIEKSAHATHAADSRQTELSPNKYGQTAGSTLAVMRLVSPISLRNATHLLRSGDSRGEHRFCLYQLLL